MNDEQKETHCQVRCTRTLPHCTLHSTYARVTDMEALSRSTAVVISAVPATCVCSNMLALSLGDKLALAERFMAPHTSSHERDRSLFIAIAMAYIRARCMSHAIISHITSSNMLKSTHSLAIWRPSSSVVILWNKHHQEHTNGPLHVFLRIPNKAATTLTGSFSSTTRPQCV